MAIIIGLGGEHDPNALKLYTRRHNYVINEMPSELPPDQLQALQRDTAVGRLIVLIRSLTATYNCMGMVFASRRTSIRPSELELFRLDDGLKDLPGGPSEAEIGDIIVYRKGGVPKHVGVVLQLGKNRQAFETEMLVLSKWGEAGECVHLLGDVPSAYGTEYQILTDRRGL